MVGVIALDCVRRQRAEATLLPVSAVVHRSTARSYGFLAPATRPRIVGVEFVGGPPVNDSWLTGKSTCISAQVPAGSESIPNYYLLEINAPGHYCCHNDSKDDDPYELLAQLPELRMVKLSWTSFDDSDVPTIAKCRDMEALYLTATRVTDESVDLLTGLQQLQVLDVRGTDISPKGIERLQEALPSCQILYTDASLPIWCCPPIFPTRPR